MPTVRFKAGTLEIRAEVVGDSPLQSQYTGKNLFQIEVEFRADEGRQDEINAARGASGAVLLRTGEPPVEVPITIAQNMHSFTVGRREQLYKWTLTEKEDLKLETLELGEVVLNPYKFEEEIQNGSLIINARVEVDALTQDALRTLPKYFPVIRRGISDEPRSMRFGQPLWSETESGNTKQRYVLVEESYDATPSQGFLEPQFGNVRDSLAVAKVQLEKLIQLLESKGLISSEEIASLTEVSDSEVRNENRLINRVDDIDEWLD